MPATAIATHPTPRVTPSITTTKRTRTSSVMSSISRVLVMICSRDWPGWEGGVESEVELEAEGGVAGGVYLGGSVDLKLFILGPV